MEPEDQLALLVADVFELAGALRSAGETIAAEVGQTQARWQLLSVVSEGDWTVSDAARRLGISRQAVQRVADALVDEGLLRHADNPAHRRAPLLRLTTGGARTLRAITRRSLAWRREVAAELPSTAVADLRRGVRRLLALLEVDGRPGRERHVGHAEVIRDPAR
ncbi:MAG TPA: MarR family winged helix-turn-helix transcriptional regulator [Acidimicrobiales bacterium]|nr:MarR family winged helix-turn-helix transcriptional regulator [Acidimicrobiales bacterium]